MDDSRVSPGHSNSIVSSFQIFNLFMIWIALLKVFKVLFDAANKPVMKLLHLFIDNVATTSTPVTNFATKWLFDFFWFCVSHSKSAWIPGKSKIFTEIDKWYLNIFCKRTIRIFFVLEWISNDCKCFSSVTRLQTCSRHQLIWFPLFSVCSNEKLSG